MKARTLFDRQKTKIQVVLYTDIIIVVLACIFALSISRQVFSWVFLIGSASLAVISLYAQYFSFGCPRCGEPLGFLFTRNGRMFIENDPLIKSCPYCQLDFDANLSDDNKRIRL